MCRKYCNRGDYHNNYCDRGCRRYDCFDNRCDDFLLPMMFWLMRDMTRNYRCNWVNRYDKYRC